ncbi:MAG: nucleotidyl transferase AbiEii/AbiGii toxin family protein [Deltaproteobacteria bacterium]|nr:nucleotidyl transferase AbiEii/AbiGii toxin family protein [Deltaproteobacteria bacterium]
MLALLHACQARVSALLGGGAALSGAWLAHRLSRDIDLVCHQAEDVRVLVRELPEIGRACGVEIEVVRDAGTLRSCADLCGRSRPGVDMFEGRGPRAASVS